MHFYFLNFPFTEHFPLLAKGPIQPGPLGAHFSR
jgi:hypothetical protein